MRYRWLWWLIDLSMMTGISKIFLVIISLLSIFNQLETLSDDPLHTIDWKGKVKFNYPKPWTGYVHRFIAKMMVFNSKFRRLFSVDMLKFMSSNLIKGYFVTYKYVQFLKYGTEKVTEPAWILHMNSSIEMYNYDIVKHTWRILLHMELRIKVTFKEIMIFSFHDDSCHQKFDIISKGSALWIAQIPFAFEFESNWLNGNSKGGRMQV